MTTLGKMIKELDLRVLTDAAGTEQEISHGYVGDLLSDVLGKAPENAAWLTVQVHKNVVGVAAMKDCAVVIICGGRNVDERVVAKARDEGITMLTSGKSAFDLAGELYALGLRGGGADGSG